MRRVIGIGETILDIVFRDGVPTGAFPGGSVFNALVALGRCGADTALVTETGSDRIGDTVVNFMADNGIDTRYVGRFASGQSPVSLAFLDQDNNAQYLFYKDRQVEHQDYTYPDIQADDIVVFGSYFAVDPAVRNQVAGLLDYARGRGAILYYDVNFRPSHRSDIMKITPNLLDNLDYADIVRGSIDDFETLYRKTDAAAIYKAEVSFYCKRFICTQGAAPTVVLADGGFSREYPTAPGEVVSTIGAGDNFNAGFIFGLLRDGITRADITAGLAPAQWDALVATAQQFAAESCKSMYNYVSPAFGKQMSAYLNK